MRMERWKGFLRENENECEDESESESGDVISSPLIPLNEGEIRSFFV
jgi:hypothetical protein